jgi:hypothetical protein
MRVSRDGWLAGVMHLAGLHVAQCVRRCHLLQETILVPLQENKQAKKAGLLGTLQGDTAG